MHADLEHRRAPPALPGARSCLPAASGGEPGALGAADHLPSGEDKAKRRAGKAAGLTLSSDAFWGDAHGRCCKAQGPGEAQNPAQGPGAAPLDAVQASCPPGSQPGCSVLAFSLALGLYFFSPDPTAWRSSQQNWAQSSSRTIFLQQLQIITIGFLRARQINPAALRRSYRAGG